MNYKTMGVVNVTPDSFSDGGELSRPEKSEIAFVQKAQDFDIVDVGAESTAPFNDPIDAKTELSRLESFFHPLFEKIKDPRKIISIDTYKPEVFYEVALQLQSIWPKSPLIFNDISGQVDEDLRCLFRDGIQFDYVLSHNLCPRRELASSHMDYLLPLGGKEFTNSVSSFFLDRLGRLPKSSAGIFIDPCFGFSKTREQNQDLLRHFKVFADRIPAEHEILVGISRKSFLRFPKDLNPKLAQSQLKLDCLQTLICKELLESSPNRRFIFRSHNLAPFNAIEESALIFEDI